MAIMSVEAARLVPVLGLAVALADEGVPVRAIARSTGVPSQDVYNILKDAMLSGTLLALPKDDWPPGARRSDRHQAECNVLSHSEDVLSMACSSIFGLSRSQTSVFLVLIKRPPGVTRIQIHDAIEAQRAANEDPTDPKIVDVVVHNIRKKIVKVDARIVIQTVWGKGYTMGHDARAVVLDLLRARLNEPQIEGLAA